MSNKIKNLLALSEIFEQSALDLKTAANDNNFASIISLYENYSEMIPAFLEGLDNNIEMLRIEGADDQTFEILSKQYSLINNALQTILPELVNLDSQI